MIKKEYLLLFLLFIFHLIVNYHVMLKTTMGRHYDEAFFLYHSLERSKVLFSQEVSIRDKVNNFLFVGNGRCKTTPPTYLFIQAISWNILDRLRISNEQMVILITNSIFMAVLFLSIYGIGVIKSCPGVGVVSAFLVSFLPIVYGHSRLSMLDFPLMCMVSLSIFLLLKTDMFQSRIYSFVLIVVMVLSQFTREAFIYFFIAPFFYYCYASYRHGNTKKVLLSSVFIFLLFSMCISVVYLMPINHGALGYYFSTVSTEFYGVNSSFLYFFNNLSVYFGSFILFLISPLFLSYIINIRNRDKLLVLWLIVPIFIHIVIICKELRYLIPLIPGCVLIVVWELFNNNLFRRIRNIYILIIVLFLLLQYGFLHLVPSFDNFIFRKNNISYVETGLIRARNDMYYPVHIQLLSVLEKDKRYIGRNKRIIFLFNLGGIHSPLRYKVRMYGLPYDIFCDMERVETDIPAPGIIDWQQSILSADYIVDKKGGEMGIPGYRENIAAQLRVAFEKTRVEFELVKDIEVFDGSHVYLYKRLSSK